MASTPLTAATVNLAGWAAELAVDLSSIEKQCGHESASSDISSVATELTLLLTTLWRLHEAILVDPESYTTSFNEDLAEIQEELKLVFEEISECCSKLQKADKPTSVVIWLFKRNKVHHLQKHLAALKTTLLVMRTVLWHGKDYGSQSSDHPCESDAGPHTMHEDRAIIESVLSQNRNAIIDLHNSDPSNNVECQRSPSKGKGGRPHDHEHNHDVGTPPMSNVLRAKATAESPSPRRSFSKRGVRLGVHMSILDLGAHDAPDRLKKKWIETSRSHRYLPRNRKSRASFSGGHALGMISETESHTERLSLEDVSNPTSSVSPGNGDKTETSNAHGGHLRSLSQGIKAGPIGKGLHRMKDVAEMLKPRTRPRSPTQEEIEVETEVYGSI